MDPQKDLQPFGTAALGGEMLGAMVGGRAPAVEEQPDPAAVEPFLRLCLCAGYRHLVVISLR